MRRASFTSEFQRGDPPFGTSPSMSFRSFHGSTWRASRSISPGGRPSALAKSHGRADLEGREGGHERAAVTAVAVARAG